MATEVLGLYDTREAADHAAQALENAGFPRSQISVEAYDTAGGGAAGAGQTARGGWTGLMEKLHLMAPSADTDYYSSGLRPGQTLVTVTTADDEADRAADILDQQGAVNIDDGASAYQSGQGVAVGAYGASTAAVSEGAVIPVVEEELAVGKRQVQRGGVRVYRHVTERPVEEQVTLREEHVTVDRRPVDRAATDADFQSRDFTVTETGEEAVVGKTSRVVEEVVVGKTAQERVETVSDTVRRTDVQVEELTDGRDGRDLTR